jgi:carboxylesterase type B
VAPQLCGDRRRAHRLSLLRDRARRAGTKPGRVGERSRLRKVQRLVRRRQKARTPSILANAELTAPSLNQWFGIPYAGSTAGPRRWRPPVPIDQARDSLPKADSDGAIDVGRNPDQAGTKAVRCFEGYPAWERTPPAVPTGTEACLHVSIVAPANASRLPVYAMIHGGGYTVGMGEWSLGYPGLRHTGGAFVFVALQYRLGAFGFLNSEDVRADGTANAGLLDQRLALEFVRQHISKFGGDPERITIAGGSAGGGSVTYQLMLYGGEENPPFHAAIAGMYCVLLVEWR